jgi:energy-coupling factor transport system substrate-specific component
LPASGRLLFGGLTLVAFGAGTWAALEPGRSGISLLLVAGALIALALSSFESASGSAKELALVATLAAVAAAGRVLFAPIPGVQPVTVIAVAVGASMGPRAGAAVGALAGFSSNFFLGQGIWTPWQMLGWAACGLAGGLLPALLKRRLPFAVTCFALGFAFSVLMDVWEWLSFYPHTWQAFAVQMGRGLPFQLSHAVGNLLIALVIGPELRRTLDRFGRRLKTEVVWA